MRRDAFTFVEVLISLAIGALLVGTLCSALIHVSDIEFRTTSIRETPFLLQTLASRAYLNPGNPDAVTDDLPGHWSLDHEEIVVDQDEVPQAWMTWRLAPDANPSFIYALHLRAGSDPE